MLTDQDKPDKEVNLQLRIPTYTVLYDIDNEYSSIELIRKFHHDIKKYGGFEAIGWKKGIYLFALKRGNRYYFAHEPYDRPFYNDSHTVTFKGNLHCVIKGRDKVEEVIRKLDPDINYLEMYPLNSEGSEITETTWLYLGESVLDKRGD